jgi:tRNA threonylcarbamoyladenosine biosynthesis protein TsaE
VQGFFEGVGIKKRALSPTFIIMRRYRLARKKFSNVFHMDAYRLKNPEHLSALGFESILSNPKNLLLIEWGEKMKPLIPKDAQWLQFSYGKKEGERKITIK